MFFAIFKAMSRKRYWALVVILLLLALSIHFFSNSADRVETGYATGIYPPLAAFLRHISGWIPFSIGDILYGAMVAWFLWKCVKLIRAIFRKQLSKQRFLGAMSNFLLFSLSLYILFNLIWGINYNRKGIAGQLQLSMTPYSIGDLQQLNTMLVSRLNTSKQVLIARQEKYPSTADLFIKVQNAYAAAALRYPFMEYHTISLKRSMWGWLGNYTGFTGYYNPFTGEAQVNTSVPDFLQPFIACHEVAHQLGYAKEMEANFVGYLAATSTTDTLFHYSVYLDLFVYSNRNLYGSDSISARTIAKGLSADVRKDLTTWRDFNRRHKSPVEPVIRWLYGKYLENNQQPQGVLSYDEVTSFLIAYYKKFGRI